jgi:hypothetical protein
MTLVTYLLEKLLLLQVLGILEMEAEWLIFIGKGTPVCYVGWNLIFISLYSSYERVERILLENLFSRSIAASIRAWNRQRLRVRASLCVYAYICARDLSQHLTNYTVIFSHQISLPTRLRLYIQMNEIFKDTEFWIMWTWRHGSWWF